MLCAEVAWVISLFFFVVSFLWLQYSCETQIISCISVCFLVWLLFFLILIDLILFFEYAEHYYPFTGKNYTESCT